QGLLELLLHLGQLLRLLGGADGQAQRRLLKLLHEGGRFQRVGVVAQVLHDQAEGRVLRHQAQQLVARRGGGRGQRHEGEGQQRRGQGAPGRGRFHAAGFSEREGGCVHDPCLVSGSVGGTSRRNRSNARRAELVTGSSPADRPWPASRNGPAGGSIGG